MLGVSHHLGNCHLEPGQLHVLWSSWATLGLHLTTLECGDAASPQKASVWEGEFKLQNPPWVLPVPNLWEGAGAERLWEDSVGMRHAVTFLSV